MLMVVPDNIRSKSVTAKKLYKNVTIPVDDLIPYARNSRTHSPEQVAQIAASIKEWGFTNPILVDEDNGIIAGHGRLLAAQKLKLVSVPCIVLDGLTEAQKRAYVIADNKIALNAGWNYELLKSELEELDSIGFDLELIGFDAFSTVGNDSEFTLDNAGESESGDHYDDDPETTTTEPANPSKTMEGYVEFSMVMEKENRDRLYLILNRIKSAHQIEKLEDSLMVMVNSYAQNS
jgi:hypothetical protein